MNFKFIYFEFRIQRLAFDRYDCLSLFLLHSILCFVRFKNHILLCEIWKTPSIPWSRIIIGSIARIRLFTTGQWINSWYWFDCNNMSSNNLAYIPINQTKWYLSLQFEAQPINQTIHFFAYFPDNLILSSMANSYVG